jgi:hypothetical protein
VTRAKRIEIEEDFEEEIVDPHLCQRLRWRQPIRKRWISCCMVNSQTMISMHRRLMRNMYAGDDLVHVVLIGFHYSVPYLVAGVYPYREAA